MYNSGMEKHPHPAKIVSKRRKRLQKQKRSSANLVRSVSIGGLTVFSVLLVAAILLFTLVYVEITSELPSIEGLPALLGESGVFQSPTEVYDRDGEILLAKLENPNTSQAEYLFLELIPQDIIDATLAVRDPNFWEHAGFQISAEKPTIAEQLVLDMLLSQEPGSIQRTWRTRLLAAQITKSFGRETILEWYLNNAGFGQMAFGVDEAAWVYFGKPASRVSLAEAALLAATVDAPDLNPIDAPQVASERQGNILQTMLALGLVSREEALNANRQPIMLQTSALPLPLVAPEFTNLALDTLYAEIGKERFQRGGYRVTTTIDLSLQEQLTCTLDVQLDRLKGSLPVDTLGSRNCPAATLLPRLSREELMPDIPASASAVILSPETGEVLALAGEAEEPFQAGTILSPFIYLTAFTRGLGPASLVWDIPASLPPQLEGFGNLDNTFHGPMRVRTAFSHDYVVPILSTLRQIGPSNAWRVAQQSGLSSLESAPGGDEYAPFLTDGRVSLIEVTHAFSMFANQGSLNGMSSANNNRFQPVMFLEIIDSSGRFWEGQQPETRVVTNPQLAYLLTDMLSDEEARRESLGNPNPFQIARPVAAKLGQGLTEESTWSIGYTPDYVVGVWVGIPEIEDPGGEIGLSPMAAAGIWNALMKTAHQDVEVHSWTEPIGIERQVVCDPSGLLPTEECPRTVSEVFITGNLPLHTDNLYRTFLVNTQTGRLATIYTPTEFLEERVYLVIPPEAEEWALQEGLDIPPDTYDVIFNPGPPSEEASLLSPEIFSYVSGEVEITGSAGGDRFDFYRLQVGEGLNPRQWLQIGEDINRPVSEGLLATWDTSGLDGLYAIRLQVVAEDQSIETVAIQVTVDNQPPAIQILSPGEGRTFEYPEIREITFQAQVDDNLDIARVEFWLNGSLLSNLSDPPYAAPWRGTRGEHELEVRAIDLAGNISIALVSFEIE